MSVKSRNIICLFLQSQFLVSVLAVVDRRRKVHFKTSPGGQYIIPWEIECHFGNIESANASKIQYSQEVLIAGMSHAQKTLANSWTFYLSPEQNIAKTLSPEGNVEVRFSVVKSSPGLSGLANPDDKLIYYDFESYSTQTNGVSVVCMTICADLTQVITSCAKVPKIAPIFVHDASAELVFPDSLFCPGKASLTAKGYRYEQKVMSAAIPSAIYYDYPNSIVSNYFSYGTDGTTVELWFKESQSNSTQTHTRYEFLGAQHNLHDGSAVSSASDHVFSRHVH